MSVPQIAVKVSPKVHNAININVKINNINQSGKILECDSFDIIVYFYSNLRLNDFATKLFSDYLPKSGIIGFPMLPFGSKIFNNVAKVEAISDMEVLWFVKPLLIPQP